MRDNNMKKERAIIKHCSGEKIPDKRRMSRNVEMFRLLPGYHTAEDIDYEISRYFNRR